jgi:hypothetical protein
MPVQVQLGEYSLPTGTREVLMAARTTDRALWFPHPNQRAFITWAPEPSPSGFEDEEDVETAPWVKTLTKTGTGMRLATRQVVERLESDAAQDDYELVRPVHCQTCRDPVPDTELVESAVLSDSFCSACCLHECEYYLGEPLTPTRTRDVYPHPLHHVYWAALGVEYADSHLPRWTDE